MSRTSLALARAVLIGAAALAAVRFASTQVVAGLNFDLGLTVKGAAGGSSRTWWCTAT